MKQNYALKLAVLMTLTAVSLQWSSCGSNDPVDNRSSETERVTAILTSHDWKIQSVTVDGVDQTALFSNFSIAFNAKEFSTLNGDPVWPINGTWSFADKTATVLILGDGLTVTIIEAVSSSLILQLTWDTSTIGGRNLSVSGVHVFSLN